MWWLLPAAAWAGGVCEVWVDGAPAERLDCEAGGTWVLHCALPEPPAGRVRVKAAVSAYGLEVEARVGLAEQQRFEVPIAGPQLRAGAFLATKPVGRLATGQAAGLIDFCPLLQADGVPGERATHPVVFTVSSHRQTGFAEETMAGGVVNRVPTYDAGTVVSSLSVPALQKLVGQQPPKEVFAPPLDTPVRGQLQLPDPAGVWRLVAWTGRRVDVPMPGTNTAGTMRLLTLDFVASEVEQVAGGDPVAWLEADLQRWLAGDPSAYLGIAGFARSELLVPFELAWSDKTRAGHKWRVGAGDRVEVALTRVEDRVRVAIGWRMSPFDPAAHQLFEVAASDDL